MHRMRVTHERCDVIMKHDVTNTMRTLRGTWTQSMRCNDVHTVVDDVRFTFGILDKQHAT